MDAALHLQPGTKHVVVVGGVAPCDRYVEGLVKQRFHRYESKFDFTYLTDLAMPALLERLNHLLLAQMLVILALLRQMAERRKTEAELVRSNERLRSAMDKLRESQNRLGDIVASAMDAIIAVDEDQRIVLFNDAAEKMFTCAAPEAIGSSIDRFIPKRFQAAHREHVHLLASKANGFNGTYGRGGGDRKDKLLNKACALYALQAPVLSDRKKRNKASIRRASEASKRLFYH